MGRGLGGERGLGRCSSGRSVRPGRRGGWKALAFTHIQLDEVTLPPKRGCEGCRGSDTSTGPGFSAGAAAELLPCAPLSFRQTALTGPRDGQWQAGGKRCLYMETEVGFAGAAGQCRGNRVRGLTDDGRVRPGTGLGAAAARGHPVRPLGGCVTAETAKARGPRPLVSAESVMLIGTSGVRLCLDL